jgi:hypothetical protein
VFERVHSKTQAAIAVLAARIGRKVADFQALFGGDNRPAEAVALAHNEEIKLLEAAKKELEAQVIDLRPAYRDSRAAMRVTIAEAEQLAKTALEATGPAKAEADRPILYNG